VLKILLQVVFLFCRRGEKDQLKKRHLIDSGEKLISFKMSLQEKKFNFSPPFAGMMIILFCSVSELEVTFLNGKL
jgi:hypothetical protein